MAYYRKKIEKVEENYMLKDVADKKIEIIGYSEFEEDYNANADLSVSSAESFFEVLLEVYKFDILREESAFNVALADCAKKVDSHSVFFFETGVSDEYDACLEYKGFCLDY